MTIDKTVEDRHAGFLAHIDKRFDEIDKRFDTFESQLEEFFKTFVYKSAFITTSMIAASLVIVLTGFQFSQVLIN